MAVAVSKSWSLTDVGAGRGDMEPGNRIFWRTQSQILALPISGTPWDEILDYSTRPLGTVTVADQNSNSNVYTLAKAIRYARTGEESFADEVRAACAAVIGTQITAPDALGPSRNVAAFVIAADLVKLPGAAYNAFTNWLQTLQTYVFPDGRTIISTHEIRPNNIGTMAGCSRIAMAVWLNDQTQIQQAADVFRGWLGDQNAYQGFTFGGPTNDLTWQPPPYTVLYGINPLGAVNGVNSIDGVLPDDQRRGGAFTWPPPQENYVYEALQGALGQALLLSRQGYDVYNWSDQALRRAYEWLQDQCNYPADGDDTWQPYAVNFEYGLSLPETVPARPGKNLGYTDWTHQ